MQDLLTRTAGGQKENSDLSAGAKVPRYGWTEAREREERKKNAAKSEEGGAKQEAQNVDVRKVLDEYRAAHPNFTVTAEGEGKIIKVNARTKATCVCL